MNPHGTIGNERGMSMASALPMLLILLVFAATGLRFTQAGMHFSARRGAEQRSLYVADGGVQAAIARLHGDRYAAAVSTGYSASGTGWIRSHSYQYSITQDPAYPSDPTRKRISSAGTADGTTTRVVSQVRVFPFTNPPVVPPSGDGIPTCDWALFANRGDASLVSTVAATTDLLDGNVHSNGRIHVRTTAGATVRGSGRFQSVGDTLVTTQADFLANMTANLFRGGSFVIAGPHSHAGVIPTLGIHFNNGLDKHGAQQALPRLPFPAAEWRGFEQDPAVVVVEEGSVPFGTWDAATDTWVVSGVYVFPSEQTVKYYVRGNVRFEELTLARATDALLAARGTIEIRELSLLQSNAGSKLAVGLNSSQTLRALAEEAVYVGRGLAQSEAAALGDAARPGVNLSSAATTTNRIAAYSERSSVWMKSSSITALTSTRLNLVADENATFAVTGALASSPRGYCQRLS